MPHNETHAESVGMPWLLGGLERHYGQEGATKVKDAVAKARAAGVPWLQIFATLLPLIMSLFGGGQVDLAGIIQAILALIHPPTP